MRLPARHVPPPALPMNYRHAYHAGNFADVVKHAILTRILVQLGGKPAAFRVIDSHAGAGRYDLAGPEATRSGEWHNGVERLASARLDPAAASLLAAYRALLAAHNPDGRLRIYPGSPAIAQAFLRPQDRLTACELEPNAVAALKHNFAQDRRVKVVALDGWKALGAFLPPPERRGLVLIDPPYEQPGEFSNLVQGLEVARRRWAHGIYLLWYPVKGRAEPDALARRLRRSGISKILRAELNIAPAPDPGELTGCGLIIVNPPWRLEQEVRILLAALAPVLAGAAGGGARVDWIAGEI
jgi:23S rRNA (adenine2030-N6)-methyltransferase